MKIYIIGSVGGWYRAQNIIKVLGDAGISFFSLPVHFFRLPVRIRSVRIFFAALFIIITAPIRLLMILFASHAIVLPMNFSFLTLLEIFLAKLFRKKVIIDYYISIYDTVVNDRQTVKKGSVLARIAKFKDKFLMTWADVIIFLNQSEAQYYQSVAGVRVDQAKIAIIPLCVDFRKELFIEKRSDRSSFNVCWWGTYIPLHGLDNIVKAFSLVQNNNIKLYIFGNSDEAAEPYKTLINELGLADRVFIDNQPTFSNGRLAPFLAENCDLALGNFGSSEKAQTVLINKLVDSLSLGLPCLTRRTKAISELFERDEGLIICDANPESIASKIESCASNLDVLRKIGRAGKVKYLENFSPDNFKIKFQAIL